MGADLAGSLLRRSGEEVVKARLKEETEAALRRCGGGADTARVAVILFQSRELLVAASWRGFGSAVRALGEVCSTNAGFSAFRCACMRQPNGVGDFFYAFFFCFKLDPPPASAAL